MTRANKALRSRDRLKLSAQALAEMVCHTPSLAPEVYAAACEVLRIAYGKQGRKSQLTLEQQWEIVDFISGKIRGGFGVGEAVDAATKRWPLGHRSIESVWRELGAGLEARKK